MNPEEKELLDYLYTVGQNVRDYMRLNGYGTDNIRRVVSIDVTIWTDEKYDRISAYSSEHDDNGLLRMVRKEDNILEDKREYKVIAGGN